jgi:glycosyltransferase involved in cell wall biosynthesis
MPASVPLSIIIPVYNNAATLEAGLAPLQPLRKRGHEVLVVDGGSRDGSVTLARKLADRVLLSGTGCALQMNAGSEYASHEILLFLPHDCRLPAQADIDVANALDSNDAQWGHFGLQIAHGGLVGRALAMLINRRASHSGAAIFEQGLFARRQYFERVKGFDTASVPSRRLLLAAKPVRLPQAVTSLTQECWKLW